VKATTAISLTALWGFVAGIASHGLLVPEDLKAFDILAASASMAGLPLGKSAAEKLSNGYRNVAAVVSFLFCAAATVAYIILIQRGSANISDIVILAGLISVLFFSFSFLLPLAGFGIGNDKPSGS
jgi:hypothetical protein